MTTTALAIPALNDSVIWQSQAFIVRDRTRTRTTGNISLWLCDCGGQGLKSAQPSTDYAIDSTTPQGDIKAGLILSPNLSQMECLCDRKVALEEVNKPEEVQAYIASELAVALQICRTHQDVLATVEDFTPEQRKNAWALLSKKRQGDLKRWKQVYEKFPVGLQVRHKDVYMVAHIQHGEVVETRATEVIVLWRERVEASNPMPLEAYEYNELEVKND